MADRPALAEIEITPEMIEAGANAVDPYDAPFLDYHQKAELIFRAMLAKAGYRAYPAMERGAGRPSRETEAVPVRPRPGTP